MNINKVIVVIILFALAYSVCGCNEKQRPKWGNGEVTEDFQTFFGNDNMARLNSVQTAKINAQGQLITELAERVRKLEDGEKEKVEIAGEPQ